MNETEKRITQLIEGIQKIEMCKRYIVELDKNIMLENRRLDALIRFTHDLNKRFEETEKKKFKSFFIIESKSETPQQQEIKEKYEHNQEQVAACKKSLEQMNFQLAVLEEKVDQETAYRRELSQLILERARVIEQTGSPFRKSLLNLVRQIDETTKLQQEIREIIDEGLNVIQTIDHIQINIIHNLKKTYNTDRKTDSYSTISVRVVQEIQALAMQLRQSLKDFKKELRDVYDENLDSLTQHHERIKYYNALVRADILVNKLLQRKMTKEQADQLEVTKRTVMKINDLFEEELRLTAEFIKLVREKKTKLLKDSN